MAFPGTAALAEAFGQGGRIERDSFGRELQRLSSAAATQALLDKRVKEAAILGRQDTSQQGLQDNPIDLLNPNALSLADQVTLFLAGGGDLNNFAGSALKGQEFTNRNRLEAARTDEGFTLGNAISNALQSSPELTPNIDVKGGIGLTDQFSGNAQLAGQDVLDALNAGGAASGAPGVREQKIQDLMRIKNPDTDELFTRREAVIKTDFESLRVDPLGNIITADEFNRSAESVALGGGDSSAGTPTPPSGGTLLDLTKFGTGVAPITKDIFARFTSLFPGTDPSFESSEAIARIKTMAIQIVNAQRQNPRFSEGERKDLLERFNVSPGLLRSPGYLDSQLIALRSTLEVKASQAEADAGRRDITTKAIGEARNSAREARNAIALIGSGTGTAISGISQTDNSIQVTPEMRASAINQLQALPGFDELSPQDQEELIERFAQDRSN